VHDYKDLKRLTKVATVILGIYLLLDLIASAGAVIEGPAPTGVARASDFVALVELVALITSFCVVGRWIYRASANAHGLSDYLSISPGWAVGWLPRGSLTAWVTTRHSLASTRAAPST